MFINNFSSKREERSSLLRYPLQVPPKLNRVIVALRQLGLALMIVVSMLSINPSVATAAVPPNFEDTFVTSVSGPTDLTWTPDGRMLIIGKGGQLRIYTNGALLPAPALDISTRLCTVGEQGLVGIVVHPNFASNRYIYLYYTYNKFNNACPESQVDGPVDRFSRFTLPDTNIIDPASEVVLFETPPRYRNHHTGGDPKFGKDGYIYITVGDAGGQSLGWPQDLGRLSGKLLRITDTGGIPAGNPFTGAGTARCNVGGVPPAGSPAGTKCQEIYSSGLRNPFRQAMDPNAAGVRFFINDVGQHSWEEISEGPIPGGNYGWPVREGPCAKDSDTDCGLPPAGMTDPVHWHHHGEFGGAATAGAFIPNGVWHPAYDSTYLFADYVFGKIYQLIPNAVSCRLCSPPTSAFTQMEFASIAEVVSMRFGPYGTGQALYYVTR
ncbi:MAG TPA: PQQ-dependent sugar dehydrogenase, partial [Anaerolineales bacterium]|nr:PQQ-dependent sugar dehydrogenase [Anaerolineales bacterium]